MTTLAIFVAAVIVLLIVGMAADRWRRRGSEVAHVMHGREMLADALATTARRRPTSELRAHNEELDHDPSIARCPHCDTALSRAASVDGEPRYMPRCPGCGRDVSVRMENGLPVVTATPRG